MYIYVCVYMCFDLPPNVFRVSQRERLEEDRRGLERRKEKFGNGTK